MHMKRYLRAPSPAMVVALIALFVALGGAAYAVATIGSDDIINGSIRNRDFKDGTLRGQEAKRDGFGGGSIKESTLGTVPRAAVAEGVTRHAVVNEAGAVVRGRGVTSSERTGAGGYNVVFDRDVRSCAYFATVGDESAAGAGVGFAAVTSAANNVNAVRVVTRNGNAARSTARSTCW
jgi:hypothetical protein